MDPLIYIGIGAIAVLTVGVGFAGIRARAKQRARLLAEPETGSVGAGEPLMVPAPVAEAPPPSRFVAGLSRSRAALARTLGGLFGRDRVDESALVELEDALIAADVGVGAAGEVVAAVRQRVAGVGDGQALRLALREELHARLQGDTAMAQAQDGPLVILVVGVNGSGKTTTIGKLAARYRAQGKQVVLAAGDTFRAGAIEQLKVWGERSGCQVVAHKEGGDPAAVLFDGIQAAVGRGADVVICDTAGRLQAHKPLMDELAKVLRVMKKALPSAPHEVLLVLDATIGQNALSQARSFKAVVGVTGVALTKLDGTARGGVVVAVRHELDLPVKLVGLGEGTDDLRDFEAGPFVDALLGDEPRTDG